MRSCITVYHPVEVYENTLRSSHTSQIYWLEHYDLT